MCLGKYPADEIHFGTNLPDRFNLHVESCLLSTSHVESRVAVCFVTLNASTSPALFTNVTGELPARGWDVFYAVYGLEEHCVGEADFRDPERTHYVRPTPVVGLLEGAAFVRTQAAVDGARRGLQTAPAQPLPLRDVRHAVTLL